MCSHETLKLTIDNMQKDSEKARVEINTRLDKIDWHTEKISNSLTAFILKVETEFQTKKSASEKFANKLSEKMVYATAGLMLSSMIIWLIYLVIKS